MDNNKLKIIKEKYKILNQIFDERSCRLWSVDETQALPHGGIALVANATNLSPTTIHAGINEIKKGLESSNKKQVRVKKTRKEGSGRKSLLFQNPALLNDLKVLVESVTRGDPESPLRWTCKSTRKLSEELKAQGYNISDRTVCDLLQQLNYSLHGNKKIIEDKQHPDRNEQFEYNNKQAKAFLKRGQPMISVDTKKKEIIRNFRNNGREWLPNGQPIETHVHDFEDNELGKAILYGIYDLFTNEGWVSIGIDHDTSDFAIGTILIWWKQMGSKEYPDAKELLIMSDGGGSNSSRSWLWKKGIQRLADTTGMKISVCHFPPGTSKWNKIEYCIFSFITQN